jgi:tetratricopeptide (TPR) repeat protein
LKSIRRELVFGILFFLMNIIITQFVLLEDGYRANRYAYLPFIGLFYVFIIAGETALQKKPSVQKYILIPVVFLILLSGAATFQRSLVWRDTMSLFNDAISKSPDAAFSYNNRGIAKYSKGDMDGALADYNKAVDLDPRYSGAFYNRGIVFNNTGRYDEAVNDYSKAISLNPGFATCYVARGIIEMDVFKNYFSALDDYTDAISINPGNAQAYYNRGILRLRMNDPGDACLDFHKVRDLGFDKADELIRRYYN